jgi:hypothetical protein
MRAARERVLRGICSRQPIGRTITAPEASVATASSRDAEVTA